MSGTHPTAALQKADQQHYLHPFTEHAAMWKHGTRIITRAEGCYIYDSEGNRYFDGMAGLWCVNIGYGRKELAEVAHQQMLELPYYNSFFQTAQQPAIELAALLSEVTPEPYHRAFFGCSGSDGNDTIVRLARYYWQLQGKPQRQVIISRKNAYHGSTMAGASLGGMAPMHAIGGLPLPDIVHIDQPYYYGYQGDMDEAAFGKHCARALERKIQELGADRVAAFIAEPVQGAGGVIVPPDTYWPEIQRICQEYDILLAVDEVICGFGRTGEWFGSDTYQIKGDFLTIAKGLSSGYQPIGAVMVGDRVARELAERGREFTHGYTYSGHPVAAAVALKNVQIMRDERLIENARDNVMDYFQQQLRTLQDHPLVGEVRGVGFLGALEIVADKAAKKRFAPAMRGSTAVRDAAMHQHGLIVRAVSEGIVLCPPLILTREQVDEIVERLQGALDTAAGGLG